jgi:hypothetical protein
MTQCAILGCFYLSIGLFAIRGSQPRTMSWDTFSRPYGTARWHMLTQDYVLGYSQPSLRDSILERLTQTLLQLFKQLFALARSEEAVGLDPMLAGVQVVVTPFQRIKSGVRAPL